MSRHEQDTQARPEPRLTQWRPSEVHAWLWAPLIAVQFLTRIPVNNIPDWVYDEAGGRRKSLVFYPAVGGLVGAVGAFALIAAITAGVVRPAAAIIAVLATAIVTGAFHEDGLADTADGLGPHTREDSLKAMRDSRIGAYGTIALWALLSLKTLALCGISIGHVAAAMVAAHVLARWSSLPLSRLLAYAQTGVGLGSQITSETDSWVVIMGTGVMAAIVFPLLGPAAFGRAITASLAVMIITGAIYRKRLGGITGDCLGATNQIVEVVCLTLAAAHR